MARRFARAIFRRTRLESTQAAEVEAPGLAMKYLLDTTACIHILRGKGDHILEKMRRHKVADFGISILTKFELLVGLEKKKEPKFVKKWQGFLDLKISVLEFDEQDAAMAARVQAELEASGRGIGEIDTCLAGTARARGLVLVTSNVSEFARVKNLRIEDWY
jgi:tRNA(fMet)-specific endonuclease VapC